VESLKTIRTNVVILLKYRKSIFMDLIVSYFQGFQNPNGVKMSKAPKKSTEKKNAEPEQSADSPKKSSPVKKGCGKRSGCKK